MQRKKLYSMMETKQNQNKTSAQKCLCFTRGSMFWPLWKLSNPWQFQCLDYKDLHFCVTQRTTLGSTDSAQSLEEEMNCWANGRNEWWTLPPDSSRPDRSGRIPSSKHIPMNFHNSSRIIEFLCNSWQALFSNYIHKNLLLVTFLLSQTQ